MPSACPRATAAAWIARRGCPSGDILLRLRARHVLAGVDVGDEHALVVAQRPPAGAARFGRDPCQNAAESGRWKFLSADERQRFFVRREHLDARRVSRQYFDRRVENLR
jgi:hypothetical protein